MRDTVMLLLGLSLGLGIGMALGAAGWAARTRSRSAEALARDAHALTLGHQSAAERAAVQALVRPLADTLGRVSDQLARAEVDRAAAQAELREQVRRTAAGTDALRTETGRLVSALRRSEVRGRWGEVQLRRLVESAGLIEHVHFTEQTTSAGQDGDGALRPDLLVNLADGRHVVVDAKVALSAYLDASAAEDDTARAAALNRHAGEVAAHVDRLASKEYWRRYDSPEFVVLFLPAESFLSAALEVRPDLLEYAFAKDVVLATPTTLLALLRTVGHAWRQDAAARNAAEVHALGRELHSRLATMAGHLGRLGSALQSSVDQFNRTVGSLESRVLVSARRLADLGVVAAPDDDDAGLPAPTPITAATRRPVAPADSPPDAELSAEDLA
ncbi:MAG TPA: DNA recombination protein RmuC, partial [Candidatus Nanopelagicales bacterium]|nr:DNA recombination protein RmuC [Candidatus Nanopelagicales bacterium]